MQGIRDCFWRIAADVGDWTSLQVRDLLGFMEPSYVWFGWWPNLTRIIGDLLRLSPWSGGLGWQNNFGPFCSPLWILCAGYKNRFLVIRVFSLVVVFLREREKHCSCNLYFSMIIVKSLQLCGRRQIAEPCKYYLVRVIVFFLLGVCFLYFCFSQIRNFGWIPYRPIHPWWSAWCKCCILSCKSIFSFFFFFLACNIMTVYAGPFFLFPFPSTVLTWCLKLI